MTADVPTLMLTTIVSSVVMAGALLMLGWGRHQDGLQYWATSLLVSAVGYVLFLLRGRIADGLSVVLANTLISVAFAGFLAALSRFHGLRMPWPLMLVPPAIMMVLMWIFMHNFTSRVTASAFLLTLQIFWVLRLLSRCWGDVTGRGARLLSVGLVLEAVMLVMRGASSLAALMQESSILQNHLVQTLTFMVASVALLITSIGFVFMAKDRADAINLRLATQDTLTGVANRRSIMATLEKTLAHAHCTHTPMAVAMLDIDHFKKVNDGYGHLAGDQVLCHVVQVLAQHLRPQDCLGRYGGEEFLLLLPNTNPTQALALAQGLAQVVQAHPCPWQDTAIPVTISMGLWCGQPALGQNWEHLLHAADSALYRAKENGRNRVGLAAVPQ